MKGSSGLLDDVIDRISGIGATPASAEVVAAELGPDEVRQAAVVHLAALVGTELEGVHGDEVRLGGMVVRLSTTSDPEAPIRFDDLGVGFNAEGVVLGRRDGPRSLSALLRLFVYARDNSDALLYLPQAMRDDRIAAFAERVGASERFVRYVLIHFTRLCSKLAA